MQLTVMLAASLLGWEPDTVCVATGAAAQRSAAPRHASVALLADSTTVPSGGDLLVGLRFTIEDGWHIYWRNPGGSGSPPGVKWHAPAGLAFGDLQWPVPERLTSQGVTEYGYEHGTLLLASVHRTPTAALGTGVTITAAVDYVICHDICVKESATPSIKLGVAAGPPNPSPSAAEFTRIRARLPGPMPSRWKVSAGTSNDGFVLSVETGRRETTATFFPLEQGLIDDGAPQTVQASVSGLAVQLKKSPFLLRAPAVLRGVLVLPGAGAVAIDAPLAK